jgi:hypothetical protein
MPNDAEALSLRFGFKFIKFSLKREAAVDRNGNPIKDSKGDPVFNWKVDPSGDDIEKLGFDFTYDPTDIQILTDPSTFGFLCEFSSTGTCPGPTDPVEYGPPLPGSTSSFNVDNVSGEASLFYDFSSTPVTAPGETNFFAFQTVSVLPGTEVPESAFTQHPESSQQFCVTVASDPLNGCGEQGSPVPEPGTLLLLGSGILGVATKGWKRHLRS